jgi:PleD family two-component response regulator
MKLDLDQEQITITISLGVVGSYLSNNDPNDMMKKAD